VLKIFQQVSVLAVWVHCLCAAFAAQAADRPNFVWILSEDNSKHFVRLLDPAGARMPHVEKLAAHGLIFERAFSNAPVCSTARSTLASASYGPRMGLQFHRNAEPVNLPAGTTLWNAMLRQAGYYTANNHKTDYNFIWPEGDAGPWDSSKKGASWRDRPDGASFFYMTSNPVTHESRLHADKPTMDQELKTDPASVSLADVHPDTVLFRKTYARYHDRHKLADDWVGEIVTQLEEDGLLEDTFIFYFGDHGGVVPGSKGYANERGLHVPMVVRVPKNFEHLVPTEWNHGTRLNGFVSFVDFGPTILALAGLDPLQETDGQAFMGPDVMPADLALRNTAYGYADRFDEKLDMVRTVRVGRLKYVRRYWPHTPDGLYNEYRYKQLAYQQWRDMFEAGKLNEAQAAFFLRQPAEQLFDVENDPYETNDLANDPTYANDLSALRQNLDLWLEGMPDLSFIPEPVLVQEALSDPVAYGQARKSDILKYKAIADLQLLDYQQAADALSAALASDDPIDRYWGLVVACSFGEAARALVPTVQSMTKDADQSSLVMARAGEFLGLLDAADARSVIADALLRSQTMIEATWVLHSAAVLHDVKGVVFNDLVRPEATKVKKRDLAAQRIEYVSE